MKKSNLIIYGLVGIGLAIGGFTFYLYNYDKRNYNYTSASEVLQKLKRDNLQRDEVINQLIAYNKAIKEKNKKIIEKLLFSSCGNLSSDRKKLEIDKFLNTNPELKLENIVKDDESRIFVVHISINEEPVTLYAREINNLHFDCDYYL